jgi:DNA replication protein DnaC
MSGEDIAQLLRGIGLRSPADVLRAFLQHATKSKLSPAQVLEELVAIEWRERDAKNLERRLRLARLGNFLPVDKFDWDHPKKIDRDLYEELLNLDFVERGENVLLRGQAGAGKTTLAQNLGHAALKAGYSVRFTTLATALTDLLKQESLPALDRRLRRYVNPHLLIIDEIGYIPCDNRSADVLYNIITRRHEQSATVITTNLSFKQWGTVFPGAACIAALIDRFAQHLHVLDIDAESYRPKKPREPQPPTAARARRRTVGA